MLPPCDRRVHFLKYLFQVLRNSQRQNFYFFFHHHSVLPAQKLPCRFRFRRATILLHLLLQLFSQLKSLPEFALMNREWLRNRNVHQLSFPTAECVAAIVLSPPPDSAAE